MPKTMPTDGQTTRRSAVLEALSNVASVASVGLAVTASAIGGPELMGVAAGGALIAAISKLSAKRAASISFERLATIEKDLTGLIGVAVIADVLDDPSRAEYNKIYDAMHDNFMEGVQYAFLISPEHFDNRRDEFMRYFAAIYKKALFEAPTTGAKSRIRASSFEDLCRIFRLRRPWRSFPYIFYRLRIDGQDSIQTIAYRGGDVRHGLSRRYYEVASPGAIAILRTCAMVLKEEDFNSPNRDEVTTPSNVGELLPAA